MLRAFLLICGAVGASAGLCAVTWAAPRAPEGGAATRRGCGKIPAQGCCDGAHLWWCDRGVLRSVDCTRRSRCGWRESGTYDCNTSGSFDPSGRYAKHCTFGDAGPPRRSPDGSACGGISVEGCCTGERLSYCEDGRLRHIDCGRNPLCGWRGVGQLYNCGTTGEADPRGRFPQACPPGSPSPPGADRASVTVDLTRLRPRADAGTSPPGREPSASSCSIGATPRGQSVAIFLVVLVAVLRLAARRRRCRSEWGR